MRVIIMVSVISCLAGKEKLICLSEKMRDDEKENGDEEHEKSWEKEAAALGKKN